MGNLVLTRKVGEAIKLTDGQNKSIIIELTKFSDKYASFVDEKGNRFCLDNSESLLFMGGSFTWLMPKRDHANHIRVSLDFPESVNIVRTELLK